MTDYEAIRERQIRADQTRRVIAFLMRGTQDPNVMGRRVAFLNFLQHRNDEDAEKGKEFAARMGVSESRVSIALSTLSSDLEKLTAC